MSTSLDPAIKLQSPNKHYSPLKLAIVKPFVSRKVISPINLARHHRRRRRRRHSGRSSVRPVSHQSPLGTTEALFRHLRKEKLIISNSEDEWDMEEGSCLPSTNAQSDPATIEGPYSRGRAVPRQVRPRTFSRKARKVQLSKQRSRPRMNLRSVSVPAISPNSSDVDLVLTLSCQSTPIRNHSSASTLISHLDHRGFLVHSTPNNSSIASTCSPSTPWSKRSAQEFSMDSISFVYDPPMISDEFLKGPAVALSPEAEAFVLSSPFNPMGLKVKPTIGEETQPKRLQFTEKKAPLNIHQGSPINPDLLKSIAPYIPTSLRTGTEKKFVAPVAPKVKKTVPIHQEGFKSIPVMVGPESLPYARNPSGVDGSVLDSDGRLNVWRPSVDDPEPEHLDHLHFQRRPGAPNPPHRAVSQEEDNSSAYAHPSMFRVYTMRDKAAMMNKSQQPFSTNKVSASYIPSSFPVRSPSMSTNPSHVSSLPIPSSRSPLPSGNRLDHAQHSLHSNQSAHREHDFSHLHPSYPVSSSDPRRFNELPTGQQYPSQGPDGFLQAQMGLVHDPMFLGQDILHLTASLLNLGLDPAVVLLHTARHMALMNSGLPSELIPYASRANASMHLGFDRSPSPGGPQIFSPQHVENSTEWATPASNSSVHYHAPLHVAPRISPSLSPTLVDVHQDVLPHLIDLAALDSDPVLPKIQVESIAHYRDDQVRIPSPYPIGDFIVPSLEHEKQLLKELKPAANLFAPPMDALPMAFESVSKPREESFLSTVHSVELPIVKTRSLTESALKPSWEEPIFLPAGSGAGFANGGLRLCGPRAKVPRRSIEEMALEAIEVACTWEEPAESSALKRERISLTEAIEATKEAARQEAIRKTREENEMKMRVLAEIEVANSRMKNQQLKEEKGGGKKIVEVKAGLPGRVVSGAAGDPSKSKKESYLTLGGLNKMFSEPPLGVNVSDSPLHQTRRVISEPVYKQNFRSSSTALMSGLPQKPAVKSSATTPSKSKLPVRAKALPVSKTSDSDTAGSVEHTARVSRKSKNSRPSNRAQVSKPFSSVLK